MLIVFPLGLSAMAVVFALLPIALGGGYWSEIACWMIAARVVTDLENFLGMLQLACARILLRHVWDAL